MTIARLTAILRQAAAIAAIVLGAIPQLDLPTSVRVPLITAGGIVLAIEHYLAGNTPTTPAPPAPPAPPAA